MKRLLSDNKGAVSVLIVMTMIVVVTFGLLAINSALYSNRLSYRSMDNMETHYVLDYSGEALISQFDAALYQSEQQVLSYFASGGYLLSDFGAFPAEVTRQIQVGYAQYTTPEQKSAYLKDAFYRLYLYSAMSALNEMKQADPSVTVLLWNEPEALAENLMSASIDDVKQDYTLMAGCTITDNNTESETLLDVLIRVQVPGFDFSLAGETLTATRTLENVKPRFGVVAWREYKQTDMSSDVQYWDGRDLQTVEE